MNEWMTPNNNPPKVETHQGKGGGGFFSLLDNKLKNDKNVIKIISFVFSMVLFFLAFLSLVSPIVRINGQSITPFNFMFSTTDFLSDFGIGNTTASYWLVVGFHYMFAGVLAALVIAAIFVFVDKRKDRTKGFSDHAMAAMVMLMLVQMLIGMNLTNVFNEVSWWGVNVRSGGIWTFVLGLIILITKYFINLRYRKQNEPKEFEKAKLSVMTSFVIVTLVFSTILIPIYIFPGTPWRITALNILIGDPGVLYFLPMSGAYRFITMFFLIISFISFFVNLILYLKSKKIFSAYNKINNLIGTAALIIYFLMGINYLIVWLDTGGYEQFMFLSWDTYAYIPLVLFILYWVGTFFARLAYSKLHVEYKVYAKAAGAGAVGGATGNVEKKRKEHEITGIDPIPTFSELDRKAGIFNNDYAQKQGHIFENLTLSGLVHHIIEYAKHSKERLSYGTKEIKTFIAGIAASRLSILQGLSGTGKTSLPKIFMEAIDGICEMVAVESSWRDKNELLGYYNEFNKKFTPKTFTQALYKASLNKDTPVFIVLDEMNLSRVEYYFSDFLSLMEEREHKRNIKLYDVQLYPEVDERAEYLSLREGHTLDIPTNVWFIGTANRDESTFEISDKVYDRAQTMNFDKRAPKVSVNENTEYPKKFVSYAQLKALFEQAKNISFDAENNEIVKKVEVLMSPYKILFGNRILKQIEDFVKVYVLLSDMKTNSDYNFFIHEAIDCIVFSKIVRKLEFKQINDIDELVEKFSALKLPLCEEFLKSLQNR
ncbi:MAG: AAA family ATPase [Firmicutes bacterium]|nr:AAA family ATPase [Bacillota bacterium]